MKNSMKLKITLSCGDDFSLGGANPPLQNSGMQAVVEDGNTCDVFSALILEGEFDKMRAYFEVGHQSPV